MPVIVDTMQCVLLLLGTPIQKLKLWNDIRAAIGKIGKESLKRRISSFNITDCKEKISAKMINRARLLNAKVDVARVSAVSQGAATFYAWCKGVLDELNDNV